MAILNRTFPFVTIMAILAMAVSMTPIAMADGEHGRERAAEVVPGHYIVHLEDGVNADDVAREYRDRGARPDHVYAKVTNGFAGEIPPGLLKRLERDERVTEIEPEWVATLESTSITQKNPPSWGLDRIDQRKLPLDNAFTYTGTGKDTPIYIVDSGVRSTHKDFGNRVAAGYDALEGKTTEDCNGHGTYVAGIAAGEEHGVAKEATIVPLRIFDCDGVTTASTYYSSLDWILDNHPSGTPGVVNLSLTASANSNGDEAAAALVDAGLVVAAAAGNHSDDACKRSPAREPSVLTVAATDSNDSRPSWSNYGTCVDLFAPGRSIDSTSNSSDTATRRSSGTSAATPFVAGAAAVLFSADPTSTSTAIHEQMLSVATTGVVRNAGDGSPDRLLFADPTVTGGDTSDPAPVAPPTADFVADCTDLACTFDASSSEDGDASITSYDWELGDGQQAAGVQTSHSYAEEGTYEVILTVTDDNGETDSATRSVNVSEPQDDEDEADESDDGEDGADDSDDGDAGDNEPLKLDGSASQSGNSWSTSVTATLSTGGSEHVISYTWESHRGNNGTGQCTTGADGTCEFGTLTFHNREHWVTFTVTDIDDTTPSSAYPTITLAR